VESPYAMSIFFGFRKWILSLHKKSEIIIQFLGTSIFNEEKNFKLILQIFFDNLRNEKKEFF